MQIQNRLFHISVVSTFRLIWRNILILKYPQLEFVKRQSLRSLSGTFRNPGIVNVILHLEGDYNVDAIKESLLNGVLQQKNKCGGFCFPKLRSNLVTCWGFYAWKTNTELVSLLLPNIYSFEILIDRKLYILVISTSIIILRCTRLIIEAVR